MKISCFISSLLIFIGWMRIIGNPHVVETVLGFFISICFYFYSYFKLKKLKSELLEKWASLKGMKN